MEAEVKSDAGWRQGDPLPLGYSNVPGDEGEWTVDPLTASRTESSV